MRQDKQELPPKLPFSFTSAPELSRMTGLSAPTVRARCNKVEQRRTGRVVEYNTRQALEAIFHRPTVDTDTDIDFERERARSEKYRADLLELDRGERMASLIPYDRTQKMILECVHAAKTKLLAVPASIAAEATAISDANELEALFLDRLEEALREITEIDMTALVASSTRRNAVEEETHGSI